MDKYVLAMVNAQERNIYLRDVAPEYKAIKHGIVNGVLANPLNCPSYNEDVDLFPMAGNDINTLMSAVYNAFTRFESYVKSDTVADGDSNDQNPQLSRYLMSLMIKQSQGSGI